MDREGGQGREGVSVKEEDHTESLSLEVLIGLVSERVTHVTFDWADGVCRAELKTGREQYVGRGQDARIALARAMLAYDSDRLDHKRIVTFKKAEEAAQR